MSFFDSNDWTPSPRRRPPSYRSSSGSGMGCMFVIAMVAIILFVGGCGATFYGQLHTGHATITVTDKNPGHRNKYLIYTTTETYEDTDNWFHGKTDSSDLYGKLRIGHTYYCSYSGFRISLFSWYRNLLNCNLVR